MASERMKKRRAEFGRQPSFKIEFPGDESQKDLLLGKFMQVKKQLKLNNTDVAHSLLDFWILFNSPRDSQNK